MSSPSPLQYGSNYHIYNRGINGENIFIQERNYVHFLNLYQKHIEPITETFAFCLLRNHFHLLVKIKTQQEILKVFSDNDNRNNSINEPLGSDISQLQYPSKKFSDFFNAYAKAINAAYGRTGSLFHHPFGRVMVSTNLQFFRAIIYIHQNPQKHGFVDDFREWKHSSFRAILSEKSTHIKRDTVLGWFGGHQNFQTQHAKWITEKQSKDFSGDDSD